MLKSAVQTKAVKAEEYPRNTSWFIVAVIMAAFILSNYDWDILI